MNNAMTEMNLNARQLPDLPACRETNPERVTHIATISLLRPRRACPVRELPMEKLRTVKGPAVELVEVQAKSRSPVEPSVAGSLRLAWLQTTGASRFEKLAYVSMSLGGLMSVAGGLCQADQLLSHWSSWVKLVESVLS